VFVFLVNYVVIGNRKYYGKPWAASTGVDEQQSSR